MLVSSVSKDKTMTRMCLGVLAAFAIATLPATALAHNGLVHEGCDPAATFAAGDITVSGAFTRAMLPNARSAGGYLTIANTGSEPDTLVGAESEAAGEVQLHSSTLEGDVMKMAPVEGGIEIPAGGTVALTPSGLHMMFVDIPTAFEEGVCVEVTLTFARAGALPVLLSVGGAAAAAPPSEAGMDGMAMEHGHQ